MRPLPIDNDILESHFPYATRATYSAPNGDLTDDTLRPIDAITYLITGGTRDHIEAIPAIATLWQLEPGDLERLQDGGAILLAILGEQLPPHSLEIINLPKPR